MASIVRSNNYKALKENFVSNLNGGSIGEINAVTLVLPATVFLWSTLQSKRSFFSPYTPVAFVADWLINCCAILFAITVYSSSPLALNLLLLLPGIPLLFSSQHGSFTSKRPKAVSETKSQSKDSTPKRDELPLKPFVTMYRGSMMVITCAAILAVDFRIFPRRFAKVENWGTSLMDMGVGSFVFSAGVVGARGILKSQVGDRASSSSSLGRRLKDSLRHSIPLLVLGLIRMYSVKGVDYAEHVTEYGVHWNFFFTLGFLPPFVALFHSAFSILPSYSALALLLGVAYELVLDFTGLTAFIVSAPRTDLLSQNREGISSFFGYLAIFLAGQGAGMLVLPRESKPLTTSSRLERFRLSIAGKLTISALFWSGLFTITTSYYGLNLEVSRRLANLPYVLWVLAFNCGQLTLCILTEKLCFPDIYQPSNPEQERKLCKAATSQVLHSFNRNGLPVFLLANLLTGAVNLTLPTLDMGKLESMAVLGIYMAILGATAVGLDVKNISIKL